MKFLRFGSAFRRDLKRITKRGYKRTRLDAIVEALRQGRPLPAPTRPHLLKGDWKGYWECHVEPDWLLIHKVSEDEALLASTGTHGDLLQR